MQEQDAQCNVRHGLGSMKLYGAHQHFRGRAMFTFKHRDHARAYTRLDERFIVVTRRRDLCKQPRHDLRRGGPAKRQQSADTERESAAYRTTVWLRLRRRTEVLNGL